MALNTSSLVNGEWVTRTLDVHSVLRHHDQQDRNNAHTPTEVEHAPKLGLLTQTVIRSPLVHWILPIRLRDDKTDDVAFIGDDFVQIKELRLDGLLWDIVCKEDFGARIRNARVVGSIKAYERDVETARSLQIKDEDVDMSNSDSSKLAPKGGPSFPHLLPPQCLLLQLDTGDSVFLNVRYSTATEKYEFISSRHRVPKSMLKLQPGMHLTVDPSSRYMAVGCSEGIFTVYAMSSRTRLKTQYQNASSLQYVESEAQLYLNGVIVKMEFLYPAPKDENHIILLVIAIIRGRTRMLLYEWITGSDLKKMGPRSAKGYLLDTARRLPLLLIPLTIKSAFILVYEDFMTTCEGILHGTPVNKDFKVEPRAAEPSHHGSGSPLWTAWTRPSRREDYKATHDDMFIVREDGLIKLLEIDAEDDDPITTLNDIGAFGRNCGTAFASLDYPNKSNESAVGAKSGDLLVTGGDSCSGGTYLLEARQYPVLTEPIPNWSPAYDFATTYFPQDDISTGAGLGSEQHRDVLVEPDRLFACVGKGSQGGITEFRHGRAASIGLEVDYDTPIMNAWVLSTDVGPFHEDDLYFLLLSLGHSSGVLQLSGDASEISELKENETKLDLEHRTLTAATRNQYIIQITEKSVVVTDGNLVYPFTSDDLFRVCFGDVTSGRGTTIHHGTIGESAILFTIHLNSLGDQIFLQVLDVQASSNEMGINISAARTLCMLRQSVTSISTGHVIGADYAVVAEWTVEGSANLIFQPLAGGPRTDVLIPSSKYSNFTVLDAIVSMVVLPATAGTFILLCGTRNGIVIALEMDGMSFQVIDSESRCLGSTPAIVSRDESSKLDDSFFVSCDSKIHSLTVRRGQLSRSTQCTSLRSLRSLEIDRIWLSDVAKPGLQEPRVTAVARMRPRRSGGVGGSLLLISGSQVFVAGLSTHAKPVTRHLTVGGTPTRLIYSRALGLLIVAASVKGRSSLLFIDPDTGEDVSQPVDQKTKSPVDFVSGLGNLDERIFRLFEWSYVKNGQTWNFLIVSTSTGRLLVLSYEEQDSATEDGAHSNGAATGKRSRKLCFYTRYKFKCYGPVYSVTGYPEGLLWCAGDKLFCETLDLTTKKFKRIAEYNLPSPATTLTYNDGVIYALTSCHSLEILKLVSNDASESRIVRTHGDQLARNTLHYTVVPRGSLGPIHLVSDKLSSVVGLWPTYNTRADTLEPVFEAALPFSILRFASARSRPVWDSTRTQLSSKGSMQSRSGSTGNHEMIGLSITGSLCHFTVLDLPSWRLLRFLVDLALRSHNVCELTYKTDPMPLEASMEPKAKMHIDGDILRRCLDEQRLEELLRIDDGTPESQDILHRFAALLRESHHGELVENADRSVLIEQAYSDLEYLLRPVL